MPSLTRNGHTSAFSAHFDLERCTAEKVKMQVEYGLSCVFAAVCDDPVAVFRHTQFFCQLRSDFIDMSDHGAVFGSHLIKF